MSELAVWRGAGISVDAKRLLKVQGFSARRPARPRLEKAAAEAADRAAGLAAPQASAVRRRIEHCAAGELRLAQGTVFTCPVFEEVLHGCDEALLFVLTLGPALETEIAERYAASEPLEAYFLDAAGWLLVEQATRQLRGHFSQSLSTCGRALTARLGPGYDYRDGATRTRWPLEQQHELFRAFGAVELPVRLLESSAMIPRLSRSGLFGILSDRRAEH